MTGTQSSAAHDYSPGAIERRRGRRFPLRLNCRLCPVLMEKAVFAGTVINISRSGILMALDSAEISRVLRPDAVVRVVVDLPRHPLFSPRCLECTARVVRIVVAKAQTQVAVEIGQIRVTDQNTEGTSISDWFGGHIEVLIQ